MDSMIQRVPAVTRADVERVVKREFEAAQQATVLDLLAGYESNSDQPYRVQLAALKLARGDLRELQGWIASANQDYRDVLAAAEYPHSLAVGSHALPEAERQRVHDEDWRQYQLWLHGTAG
jgi:hypothetical protein